MGEQMNPQAHAAILTLENAGKYIVKSYNLRNECELSATQAARHENPNVQALAVISIGLAGVIFNGIDGSEDGWVLEAKAALGIMQPPQSSPIPGVAIRRDSKGQVTSIHVEPIRWEDREFLRGVKI